MTSAIDQVQPSFRTTVRNITKLDDNYNQHSIDLMLEWPKLCSIFKLLRNGVKVHMLYNGVQSMKSGRSASKTEKKSL